MTIVDMQLLKRLRDNPDHRRQFGDMLLGALFEVVRTSDYNVRCPGAPLGRNDAYEALRRLNLALEEAFNCVPGVDVPAGNR